MKILKIIAIVLVAGVLSAFAYANIRQLSPTEKLETVNLVSYKLTGGLTTEERTVLEKDIASTKGVTSCTINPEGDVASVIFHPEKIAKAELTGRLGKIAVNEIVFPATGGCPIHAMNSSFTSFISVLDLRN